MVAGFASIAYFALVPFTIFFAPIAIISLAAGILFLASTIYLASNMSFKTSEQIKESLIKTIQNDQSPNLAEVRKFLDNNRRDPLLFSWHRLDYFDLFDSQVIKGAIDKGNPALLEFLCKAKDQMNFDPEVIEYAIKSKNPEMINILFKYLSSQELGGKLPQYLQLAHENGLKVQSKQSLPETNKQALPTQETETMPLAIPSSDSIAFDQKKKTSERNYKEAMDLLLGNEENDSITPQIPSQSPILGPKGRNKINNNISK
jgi:hypothetical protein